MQVVTRIAELRARLEPLRRASRSIGFVPTMGYLHRGHEALVRAAREECDVVVVSIFVNPLQFAPNEDFESYPRDSARDRAILTAAGTDFLFQPDVAEIYPRPLLTEVAVPELSHTLEGGTRPTHFQGVATVVLKLFHIVWPDRAYFGQKDGQQVAVVRRLCQDLDLPLELRVVPTVREPDGLALSSRNVYLSPEQREAAPSLYMALEQGREAALAGMEGSAVQAAIERRIAEEPLARLDYAAVVDPDTMKAKTDLTGRVMLAAAAYFGKTRLIDNLIVEL